MKHMKTLIAYLLVVIFMLGSIVASAQPAVVNYSLGKSLPAKSQNTVASGGK